MGSYVSYRFSIVLSCLGDFDIVFISSVNMNTLLHNLGGSYLSVLSPLNDGLNYLLSDYLLHLSILLIFNFLPSLHIPLFVLLLSVFLVNDTLLYLSNLYTVVSSNIFLHDLLRYCVN